MARAPRRGQVRLALEPILGVDGCGRAPGGADRPGHGVGAGRWPPGRVHIAHDPPDAGPELRELVRDDVYTFPQNGDGIAGRLADAVGRVFGARLPVRCWIVWPDLAAVARRSRRRPRSARVSPRTAISSSVPAIDGGFYLIGIPRPLPELFSLPEQASRNADAMSIGVAAAREAGLEMASSGPSARFIVRPTCARRWRTRCCPTTCAGSFSPGVDGARQPSRRRGSAGLAGSAAAAPACTAPRRCGSRGRCSVAWSVRRAAS